MGQMSFRPPNYQCQSAPTITSSLQSSFHSLQADTCWNWQCSYYAGFLMLEPLLLDRTSHSIEQKWPIVIEHSLQPSVGLCVCLSVCPVHCGKTPDRIWMQFGMVGWMCPGRRQVVGFGHRSTRGGNFGGKCGAPHCNQWRVCGTAAPSQITLEFLFIIQGIPSSEALEFNNFQGPLQGLFKDLSKSAKDIYKMAVAIWPSRRK